MTNENKYHLTNMIRGALEKQKRTQLWLAKVIGVTPTTIWKVVDGQVVTDLRLAMLIAAALDSTVDELFTLGEDDFARLIDRMRVLDSTPPPRPRPSRRPKAR